MSLNSLLAINPALIFFIAPPAYGKTSKLIELFSSSSTDETFIYISPLRVLADEFSERLSSVVRVKNIKSFKDAYPMDLTHKVYIITPELLNDNFLSRFSNQSTRIVLDEFHLFYSWGNSFRAKMWEVTIELLGENFSLLLLSATIPQKLFDEFTTMVNSCSDYQIFKLDLGNYKLHYLPEKIFSYPIFFKNSMVENISYELHQNKNVLLFCAYRNEVATLAKFFQQKKWRVLTCVGGETKEFTEKLKLVKPQLIIATLVLSHGVNLPKIDTLFINYQVKAEDMLLQMVARGGRQGERYTIHIREKFYLKSESFLRLMLYCLKAKLFNCLKYL